MSRKTGNIYRTTISIPQDLKRRMDAVEGQVNWSAVAAFAFEEKLAEIASRRKEKSLDDVIQRLRASRLRSDNSNYRAGEEAGERWAEREAEAEQLKNLADFLQFVDMQGGGQGGRDNSFFCGIWDSRSFGTTTSHQLFFAIEETSRNDHGAAKRFWEAVLGKDARKAENLDFLRGFAAAAERVWIEVKDHI
jgi:hypothetical protein